MKTSDMWLEVFDELAAERALRGRYRADGSILRSVISVDGIRTAAWGFDARAVFGKSRLLISRKRNRNFGDIVNTWRKTLLFSSIETSVAEDFIPLPLMDDMVQTSIEDYFR